MTDRADRLFELLPAAIRATDAARGYPLRDLLRVPGGEAAALEDDIRQMYANLFIETCESWVVPYIGALVGSSPLFVPPGAEDDCDGAARAGRINPRRAVAERVGLARRKGTFSVLDDLIASVTGWPAHATDEEGAALEVGIKVWRLPSWPLTRVRPAYNERRTNCYALSLLGNDAPVFTRADPGPDDAEITADRLPPRPITVEDLKPNEAGRYYGPDKSLCLYEDGHPIAIERIVAQDLSAWEPEVFNDTVAIDPTSGRVMFPERYRTRRLTASYSYGFATDMGGGEYPRPVTNATVGMSLFQEGHIVDVESLLQALRADPAGAFTEWLRAQLPDDALQPPPGADAREVERRLAAELNRIIQAGALPDDRLPDTTPFDEETMSLLAIHPVGPRRVRLNRLLLEAAYPEHIRRSFQVVRVTSTDERPAIMNVVRAMQRAEPSPLVMVVELADSGRYVEPVTLDLPPLQTLVLRAAEGCRPTILLADGTDSDIKDMVITAAFGSRVVLDGLMIATHAVRVTGNPLSVEIRHCTLVPGWALEPDCTPLHGTEASLYLSDLLPPGMESGRETCPPELLVPTRVRIDRSITGTIVVQRDEVNADPLRLDICRSIVDATAEANVAIATPNAPRRDEETEPRRHAHAIVSVVNSTVIGEVRAHAIELGENSIFLGRVHVARRQIGCLRYCYVPRGSRTPVRHACQPDLAIATSGADPDTIKPVFIDPALRYGAPDYCRLDDRTTPPACPVEILAGADDHSEMGVYHDLYLPQRRENLTTALTDFLPLGWTPRTRFIT